MTATQDHVRIFDTTLRDGEQSPGCSMTAAQKLRFAHALAELGVDVISPVIGERSERKVFKTERSCKIVLSAMKQSLKAKLPVVEEPVSVRDFILAHREDAGIKMICYCFEGETVRRSIKDVLQGASEDSGITVLIGPEGSVYSKRCPEALYLA